MLLDPLVVALQDGHVVVHGVHQVLQGLLVLVVVGTDVVPLKYFQVQIFAIIFAVKYFQCRIVSTSQVFVIAKYFLVLVGAGLLVLEHPGSCEIIIKQRH